MATLTEYVDRSDLEHPQRGPDAKELDTMTALEFAEKKFGTEVSKMLVSSLSRDLLGVDADELSALILGGLHQERTRAGGHHLGC